MKRRLRRAGRHGHRFRLDSQALAATAPSRPPLSANVQTRATSGIGYARSARCDLVDHLECAAVNTSSIEPGHGPIPSGPCCELLVPPQRLPAVSAGRRGQDETRPGACGIKGAPEGQESLPRPPPLFAGAE